VTDGGTGPTAGDVVDDRFELTGPVGTGGFTAVWRARDRERDETVALKFPAPGTHDADEVCARVERERDLLAPFAPALAPRALLRHVAAGDHEGAPYVAQSFVGGGALPRAMADRGIDPGPAVVERVGLPVLRALGCLHANGRVHLDVRPANVRLRAGEAVDPVLVDYNAGGRVARPPDELYHDDAYKPPEQRPGPRSAYPVGPAADVFAAGKLLAYLLTGDRIGADETPDSGVDVRTRADAGVALAEAVRRATREDPAERFDDATALATAVRRARDLPTERAVVAHVGPNVRSPLRPGDDVGRGGEGTAPALVVPDPDRGVSPRHLLVAHDDGWLLQDTSLNGTQVRPVGADRWIRLLSERGREAARERGASLDARGSAARLAGRTVVAPVDRRYGLTLAVDPSPEG
jgi:serine/threonine-protein kinase